MFDVENFAVQTIEVQLDTEFPVIPEGEYPASITKVEARDQGSYTMMDVTWEVDSDVAREVTGMAAPTVRQTIFLDVTEAGGLDLGKGRNVSLGRLRAAVKQNSPTGWSPSQLIGTTAMIRLAHRLYEDKTYTDVKGVAAL